MLYEEIEARLTELLGAADTLVLPTITLIHLSVIPLLAASGTVFVDRRAHKTIYEGAELATLRGATLQPFPHDDLDALEQLLKADTSSARLICIDGVNSMTGNMPDLPAFAALAREHGAILYVDDAHGFGVIGERRADELSPYGARGNSVVRHFGETYENVVLVGGLSKAYSSLAAFIACPPEMKRLLKTAAPPYLYSGPSPVASLATVLSGLDVNERRGDAIRADLHAKTKRVLDGLDRLGVYTPNRDGLPVIEVPLADAEQIGDVGRFLFENGVYVTLAAYPLVPRAEVGFRIQVTAANTWERDRPPRRRARPPRRAPPSPSRSKGLRHDPDVPFAAGTRKARLGRLSRADGGTDRRLPVRAAAQGLRRRRERGRRRVARRDRRRDADERVPCATRLGTDARRPGPLRRR